MTANSFGQIFKITSFGESHGVGLGVVIEGCPAGLEFDFNFLQGEMARRRPGLHGDPIEEASAQVKEDSSSGTSFTSPQTAQLVSARNEADSVEVLSGVFAGKTLGTPIAMLVRNQDARSKDYEQIKSQSRTGHADDVWSEKFGHSDHRGGGRSSGRETVARVMAGAVAKMLIGKIAGSVSIRAFVSAIGTNVLSADEIQKFALEKASCEEFLLRMPSDKNKSVFETLKSAQAEGESLGGEVSVVIQGLPAGLGQPVFHKLKSDLASAMLSIGASHGFELGQGFSAALEKGSLFHSDQKSSQYGGIRGGISTGEDIFFRVAFKPTSSIRNVAKKGRHDPCIAIRATPVVESMAALVIADHLLWQRLDRI